MLKSEELQRLAQQAGESKLQSELGLAQLNRTISSLEADGGIAKPERDFKIRASRNLTTNGMVAHVTRAREIAALAAPERAKWESVPFTLSRARFSELESTHSAIATWHTSRLSKLPAPLLALEFADAKATSSWALAGLILSERAGRGDPRQAGDPRDFAVDEDAIPGRTAALKSLDAIDAARIAAEDHFAQANGRQTGIGRLHAARAQRDAEAA